MIDANENPPSAADRRAVWIAAWLLAAAAIFYLVRGMPWPNNDDLAFIGVGIDLARTGRVYNHTMNPWLAGFGTNKFYIQMPFSAYLLAGWIRLCGVSTASFQTYAWLVYGLGSYGLVRTLGRFGLPLAARLLAVILYLTLVIKTGFRPEPEAFALLFLGLSLVDARMSFSRRFTVLVLFGLSVLTYPLTVALAAPFSVAILWLRRIPGTTANAWWRQTVREWIVPAVLAAAVVLLALLVMVHGEWTLFWSVFDRHRRSRVLEGGSLLSFWRLITWHGQAALMLPSVLLLVAAAGYALVRREEVEPDRRALIGVSVIAGLGCIFLYSVRAPEWIQLLAFCCGFALATQDRVRRHRWRLVSLLGVLYLWCQLMWLVQATLQREPDVATLGAIREEALRSGKELVIDSSAARYVFDYQLPERTLNVEYIRPFGDYLHMTMDDKKPGDYWVVSRFMLQFRISDLPAVYRQGAHITLGHHPFSSLLVQPDEMVIIP